MRTKAADGLRLTAAVEDGNLELRAEADPLPALTYTEDESLDRIRDVAQQATAEKEPAAVGFLESFKPVLYGGAIVLILLLITILILRKWQKQKRKQGLSA